MADLTDLDFTNLVLDWIDNNLYPGEVFSREKLTAWATANGFVKAVEKTKPVGKPEPVCTVHVEVISGTLWIQTATDDAENRVMREAPEFGKASVSESGAICLTVNPCYDIQEVADYLSRD